MLSINARKAQIHNRGKSRHEKGVKNHREKKPWEIENMALDYWENLATKNLHDPHRGVDDDLYYSDEGDEELPIDVDMFEEGNMGHNGPATRYGATVGASRSSADVKRRVGVTRYGKMQRVEDHSYSRPSSRGSDINTVSSGYGSTGGIDVEFEKRTFSNSRATTSKSSSQRQQKNAAGVPRTSGRAIRRNKSFNKIEEFFRKKFEKSEVSSSKIQQKRRRPSSAISTTEYSKGVMKNLHRHESFKKLEAFFLQKFENEKKMKANERGREGDSNNSSSSRKEFVPSTTTIRRPTAASNNTNTSTTLNPHRRPASAGSHRSTTESRGRGASSSRRRPSSATPVRRASNGDDMEAKTMSSTVKSPSKLHWIINHLTELMRKRLYRIIPPEKSGLPFDTQCISYFQLFGDGKKNTGDFISFDEFIKTTVEKLNIDDVSKPIMRQVFGFIDANGDGRISYHEFVNGVMGGKMVFDTLPDPTDKEMIPGGRRKTVTATRVVSSPRVSGVSASKESSRTGTPRVGMHDDIDNMYHQALQAKRDLSDAHVISIIAQLYDKLDQKTSSDKDHYRQAFKVFHSDRDGGITPQDLRITANRLGLELTVEESLAVFRRFDKNLNGYVDLHEFIAGMESARMAQNSLLKKKNNATNSMIGGGSVILDEEDNREVTGYFKFDEEKTFELTARDRVLKKFKNEEHVNDWPLKKIISQIKKNILQTISREKDSVRQAHRVLLPGEQFADSERLREAFERVHVEIDSEKAKKIMAMYAPTKKSRSATAAAAAEKVRVHDFLVNFLKDEETEDFGWVERSEKNTQEKIKGWKEEMATAYASLYGDKARTMLDEAYETATRRVPDVEKVIHTDVLHELQHNITDRRKRGVISELKTKSDLMQKEKDIDEVDDDGATLMKYIKDYEASHGSGDHAILIDATGGEFDPVERIMAPGTIRKSKKMKPHVVDDRFEKVSQLFPRNDINLATSPRKRCVKSMKGLIDYLWIGLNAEMKGADHARQTLTRAFVEQDPRRTGRIPPIKFFLGLSNFNMRIEPEIAEACRKFYGTEKGNIAYRLFVRDVCSVGARNYDAILETEKWKHGHDMSKELILELEETGDQASVSRNAVTGAPKFTIINGRRSAKEESVDGIDDVYDLSVKASANKSVIRADIDDTKAKYQLWGDREDSNYDDNRSDRSSVMSRKIATSPLTKYAVKAHDINQRKQQSTKVAATTSSDEIYRDYHGYNSNNRRAAATASRKVRPASAGAERNVYISKSGVQFLPERPKSASSRATNRSSGTTRSHVAKAKYQPINLASKMYGIDLDAVLAARERSKHSTGGDGMSTAGNGTMNRDHSSDTNSSRRTPKPNRHRPRSAIARNRRYQPQINSEGKITRAYFGKTTKDKKKTLSV